MKVRDILIDVIAALAAALVIIQFVKPMFVEGDSMEPGFSDGDYVIVSRQSYGLFGGEPETGDVIVAESSLKDDEGRDKLIIKRVIGVAGDVIAIDEGDVYVNGTLLDDSYTLDGYTKGAIEDLVVPENTLFCLGDNRGISMDSRYPSVGFIELDDVIGKAVFRIWPLDRAGFTYNPYEQSE